MYNIIHVISGLGRGGAEAMLVKLLSRTDTQAFRTAVIALTSGGIHGDTLRAMGVPLVELGMAPGKLTPAGFALLRRHLKLFRPDLVSAWLLHANVLTALQALLRFAPAPLVWNVRWSAAAASDRGAAARMAYRMCGLLSVVPRRIVFNSNSSMGEHLRLGFRRAACTVIPNGFDCGVFRPTDGVRVSMRAALGLGADAFVVGNVARYDPLKDHQTLLRGFADFARARPHARLVLAGPGVSAANGTLMGQVRAGGSSEKIVLLGDRDDIPFLMNGIDVFALSSRTEAFPNVLGEAMACGVPCVSTDVGDAAYIIGLFGQTVPASDHDALAAALGRFYAMDAAERGDLGERARQRIIDHFSLESVTHAYERLFLEEIRAANAGG